jgi:hypothetical protein
MNKKIKKIRDFDIVSWDWKESCPWKLCAKFAKKYKYQYETNLDSDQNYVFFSDFKIKNDDEAEALYMLDDQ